MCAYKLNLKLQSYEMYAKFSKKGKLAWTKIKQNVKHCARSMAVNWMFVEFIHVSICDAAAKEQLLWALCVQGQGG